MRLGAVAVMDVEIDHGDALIAVRLARVQRADRDVVEQAEAHGARRLGVVAGRPDGAEGVGDLALGDGVDRGDRSARRAQRRLARARR